MEVPSVETLRGILPEIEYPPFARISYAPETPTIGDLTAETEAVVDELSDNLPATGTVAVGVGSRGIHDIVPIVQTTVCGLRSHGLEPIVVPAMGSHGGATPSGQREILAELGITEATIDCPIDAGMETILLDHVSVQGESVPVHFSSVARSADALVPINRVKPHTDFSGRIESGVCKLLSVGWGKQPGARTVHQYATRLGFVPVLEALTLTLLREVPVTGGIAIVENFHDHTASVSALDPDRLIEQEARLLEQARDWMATLPFDEIDLLVVDEIGKNISGTGMDTNVIGRKGGGAFSDAPEISTIYARDVTTASKGNAVGMGMADVIHRSMSQHLDPVATYTNALTSGSLGHAAMPMALPTDELAMGAAVTSLGNPTSETARIVWIPNTLELSTFRVSPAVLDSCTASALTVQGWKELVFEAGEADFEPTDSPERRE